MEPITVTFCHPTDQREKKVELDPTYEAHQIIDLLIEHDFIPYMDPNFGTSYHLF